MERAKITFIYAVIAVFIGVSTVGILAALGVINMPSAATAGALIGPCIGIVATLVQAKHMFDDPDAVRKIKEEHHDEILRLKALHVEREAQINQLSKDREAQHRKIVSDLSEKHSFENEKNAQTITDLKSRVKELTPKTPKPISPSGHCSPHG